MSADVTALVLLVVALALALAGFWDLIAGAARREQLRDRALLLPPPSGLLLLVTRLERGFARTTRGHALELRLTGAGLGLTPLRFVAVALACGVAAFAVASLAFTSIVSAIAAAIAVRVVFAWLDRKRDQRVDRFVVQLPELSRVLSNAASAGLGMTAALEIAARELGDPAASELRVALEEVRIGASFDEALAHLGERMPSRELGVLVTTLVIQQRSGGDLVRALGQMSDTLEARRDTNREVKTLMAGAVATAYVVAGIGICSIFLIDLISPGSLDKLTSTPIGIIVLLVSTSVYVLGFLLVRQVTRIET